jgi:hypothetical protein
LVANNYPGLLDGINPSLAFPDVFTLFPPVQDCALLNRAFAASSLPWTDAQKNAVAGFASWRNCNAGQGTTFATDWQNSYNFLAAKLSVPSATGGFPNCFVAVIPSSMLYDPVTNPGGIRCGIFDGDKTLLGVDPGTGFAKRPWDNVGVQYGLQALTMARFPRSNLSSSMSSPEATTATEICKLLGRLQLLMRSMRPTLTDA